MIQQESAINITALKTENKGCCIWVSDILKKEWKRDSHR
jgi:hypothetical protein